MPVNIDLMLNGSGYKMTRLLAILLVSALALLAGCRDKDRAWYDNATPTSAQAWSGM